MNVFIAGPRAVSQLDDTVKSRLLKIYNKRFTVLVGDANGVDKSIQQYYHQLLYSNVLVFASQGKARNNLGGWKVEAVDVDSKLKGFDYYAEKDKAMAKKADYGFMIWNGESKGTLNNIINLINDNKKSLVYFVPQKHFYVIDSKEKLEELISICGDKTKKTYRKLYDNSNHESTQMSIFDIYANT